MTVPDHIAAYAAALHHAGVGNWGDVRDVVSRAGMGAYDFRELAKAATAWARANVSTSARNALRAYFRRKGGAAPSKRPPRK